MAKLSTDELLDAFKEMTLLELSEFVQPEREATARRGDGDQELPTIDGGPRHAFAWDRIQASARARSVMSA